uniref:Ecdysone receptor n=1 Tax=Panagrolaimus sp. JU765 TaxID=591449 RepID=A0AC34QTA7_9BILA
MSSDEYIDIELDEDSVKSIAPSNGVHIVGISNKAISNGIHSRYEVIDATSYLKREDSKTPTVLDGSLCLVCDGPANGIHFRAQSCAACNAFFRRSVAENRKYICGKDGDCEIHYSELFLCLHALEFTQLNFSEQRCLCRACRLKKCLDIGMDPLAVQPQRDAIGSKRKVEKKQKSKALKQSAVEATKTNVEIVADVPSKTQKKPEIEADVPEASSLSSACAYESTSLIYQYSASSSTVSEPKEYEDGAIIIECGNLIEEVLCSYQQLLERRRLLYCPRTLRDLLSGTVPTFRKETGFFGRDHFNAETANIIEFVRSIQPFAVFDIDNQLALIRNFCLPMTIIEKYYTTYRNGGHLTDTIYHQDYSCRDLNDVDSLQNCCGGGPFIKPTDDAMAEKTRRTMVEINVPYMRKALHDICLPMAAIEMTDVEIVALMLIILFDPNAPDLSAPAKRIVKAVRDRVYEDWFSIYTYNSIINAAEKVGNVVLLTSSIQEFAKIIPQNFHFVRVFGLFDYNELLDDLFSKE